MMRFANNARIKKEARLLGALTSSELRAAQNYLVKRAQFELFSQEIQCLEMGKEIHKKIRIISLDPQRRWILSCWWKTAESTMPTIQDTTSQNN